MRPFARLSFVAALAVVAACSTSRGVDLDEPRRVLGRASDVRIDGQIFADRVGSGSSVRLVWEVENFRPAPIAIADLLPAVTYDRAENSLVVNLGSEVPGNAMVPRLIVIAPGERRVFEGVAKIGLHLPARTPMGSYPRSLQLRLSFLETTAGFEKLIGIPENAIHDPALADDLFPAWVEANETIRTNAIPIEWLGSNVPQQGPDASRRRF